MRVDARAMLIAILVAAAPVPLMAQTSPSPPPDPFAAMVREGQDAWARLSADETATALPPLKPVEPSWFNQDAPRLEVATTDGMRVAGTRDGQLYVRDRNSEEIRIVARPAKAARWTIEDAIWSPDGLYLAAKTIDDSAVPRITLTGKQFEPSGKRDVPYSRVGEPIPTVRVSIFEIATGRAVTVAQSPARPYINIIGFSDDNRALRVLMADRHQRILELRAADTQTGKSGLLHTEKQPSSVTLVNLLHGYSQQLRNLKIVNFLPDGSFVWMSDRSGFKHLTVHDRMGKPVRALTEGKMAGFVDRVIELDALNRRLFAIATGFSAADPYAHRLVRIDLDGGVATLAEAGHIPSAKVSSDRKRIRFVGATFPDTVDVIEVDDQGGPARKLYTTDWSKVLADGYTRPEVTFVPAADGKTLMRTVVAFPAGFDPGRRYPVLHYIYAGQQTNSTPLSPRNGALSPYAPTSQKGFIEIFIDGRATPGRGRAFQNADYGRFGATQAADQVAGLRALAATRPYMDLERVGVVGGSWGGYFGLRTALAAPELYKAGVFHAGAFEMARMRVAAEPFMGCSKIECPDSYAKASNLALIERLKAPLLILHGTADNDVPIEDSRALVAALKRHGKPHEYVEIDGWNHRVSSWPEYENRAVAFLSKHLGGPEDLVR